jgi:outer membrane protein assembly factor BamB
MHNRTINEIFASLPILNRRTPRPQSAEAAWRAARAIAAVFSLLVSLAMLVGHLNTSAVDPLKSSDLKSLKDQLRLNPADEQTKQRIRALDLQLRARYFRQLSQSTSGGYLLIGGVVAFIVTATQCARYRRQLPMPAPRTCNADPAQAAKVASWSVTAVGAVVGGLLLVLGLVSGRAVSEPTLGNGSLASTPAGAAHSTADAASEDEMRRNWPRFRGPGGSGVSEATNLPTHWDPKTSDGVAWKTPVPAPGFNSPIIWENRFFFSGGDSSKREVFCFDCGNGQMIWRQALLNIPGGPAQPPEIPDTTGYAASSMATDGRRVYVIFATGDVAAFTLDGKLVWSKSFGPLKNAYGYASSLATWRDRLIVLLDQGESEEGKSKLYALDGRTGQVVWQTPRKVGSSWASPIIFDAAGQPQVVALSLPWAISYGLKDGAELWRVECLSGEITPSPVFTGGLVLVPSPSDKLLAIRPDGRGEVTKTHVAWTTEENVPDVTSPVGNSDLVFTLTTPGMLTCFDAKDGKKQWEHDFEIECHSSPSLAGNQLYLFGQKGTAIVAEAGRQFKELYRTDMGDVFHASPAFTQDKIILRGVTNLWCLAKQPSKDRAAK